MRISQYHRVLRDENRLPSAKTGRNKGVRRLWLQHKRESGEAVNARALDRHRKRVREAAKKSATENWSGEAWDVDALEKALQKIFGLPRQRQPRKTKTVEPKNELL